LFFSLLSLPKSAAAAAAAGHNGGGSAANISKHSARVQSTCAVCAPRRCLLIAAHRTVPLPSLWTAAPFALAAAAAAHCCSSSAPSQRSDIGTATHSGAFDRAQRSSQLPPTGPHHERRVGGQGGAIGGSECRSGDCSTGSGPQRRQLQADVGRQGEEVGCAQQETIHSQAQVRLWSVDCAQIQRSRSLALCVALCQERQMSPRVLQLQPRMQRSAVVQRSRWCSRLTR
jgi:hypothetical protein